MFLFRGDFGCLLYTGDFRWETTSKRAEIGRSMLFDALKDDVVDILYLDNTYCNPSYVFPSREIAAQQVHLRISLGGSLVLPGSYDTILTYLDYKQLWSLYRINDRYSSIGFVHNRDQFYEISLLIYPEKRS